MNTLMLDESRVVCDANEPPIIKMFERLGMSVPILALTIVMKVYDAFYCIAEDILCARLNLLT